MNATQLYRSLYRELSIQYRAALKLQTASQDVKQKALARYRRAKGRAVAKESDQEKTKRFNSTKLRGFFTEGVPKEIGINYGDEVLNFLKSQRTYKQLLERYNSGAGMSNETRIKLSARRVGLELPKDGRDSD